MDSQTTNQPTTVDIISRAIASYQQDVTLEVINKMAAEAKTLNIAGEHDKVGYKLVDEARKEVKRKRLAVTNREKSLLEVSKNYIASVKGESKKLIDLLKPIEEGLQLKQNAIDDIKKERERKEALKIQTREQNFYNAGMLRDLAKTFVYDHISITLDQLKTFTDEQIKNVLNEVEGAKEAKRAAAEQAARAVQAPTPSQQNNAYTPGNNYGNSTTGQAFASDPAPQNPASVPTTPHNPVAPQYTQQPQQTYSGTTYQQTPAPAQGRGVQYDSGFYAATKAIIEILNDPTPINRAGLIDKIKNLKP